MTSKKAMDRFRKKGLLVTVLLCALLLGACAKERNKESDAALDGVPLQDVSSDDGQKEEKNEIAKIEQLRVPLPEGFKASTTTGLYLSAGYPEDMSNIYVYTAQKDPAFSETMQNGQQTFTDSLAQSYQSQYGETPQITMLRYESVTVGGYNAYVTELTYILQDTAYYQMEYIIDAEKTYFVAFSQVGSLQWIDTFYACAAGMYFDTEQ